jgi:hypothetical protein
MSDPLNTGGATFKLMLRSSNKRSGDSQISDPAASSDVFTTWIARVKTLKPEQRREFLAHSRADLVGYIEKLEKIATTRAGRSKAYKAAKFIRPLYELCRVLTPNASDRGLPQLDPTHSALILGGVAFIISYSGKFLDYHDKVIECLSTMLERLQVVESFETLYQTRDAVRKAAVQVCEDILDFCIEASQLFFDEKGAPRSSFKMLTSSLVSSFDKKFGLLQKRFESHHADFAWSTNLALGELLGRVANMQEQIALKDEEKTRGKNK